MKLIMTNRIRLQEEIFHKLENCRLCIESYAIELDDLMQSENVHELEDRVSWFKQMFNYYLDRFIPALEETLRLDRKHLELVKFNSHRTFNLVGMEVRHHQKMVNLFFHRFEHISNEFNTFLKNQNSNRRI